MKSDKVIFKPYDINQLKLPIDLEIQIPDNHIVKVINSIIDKMNISNLLNKYKGGGTSSYHPLMMLKVLIYAYSQRIYTSRKIAKALKENIYFMWISGKQAPDFRTINNFRSSIMRGLIDEIFSKVMELLIQEGFVNIDNYFVDGTKIEANANKYTFVWKKSMQKNEIKLQKKIQDKINILISQIDTENEKENKRYKDKDLEELGNGNKIDSKKLDDLVKKIDEELSKKQKEIETGQQKEKQENKIKDRSSKKNNKREKGKKENGGYGNSKNQQKLKLKSELKPNLKTELKQLKEQKRILKELKEDCLARLKKYEYQKEILKERNSFSKTDYDATFMRMKEDHMLNGQLKPGYNIQIGTNNQFILNYSIHQKAGDTTTLKNNIEKFKKIYNKVPEKIIADSGYGSEENYEYLKEENIESYVKYNYFHMEQKRNFKDKIYRIENLKYDKEKDEYICPNNKRLKYKETINRYSDNSYKSNIKVYTCTDCSNCSLKVNCTKSKYNRSIQINERLNELKKEVREKLLSPLGRKLRGQRCIEPESVFGQIKWNRNFKRFLLRGLDKVNIEWGLISIAHNLSKIAMLNA